MSWLSASKASFDSVVVGVSPESSTPISLSVALMNCWTVTVQLLSLGFSRARVCRRIVGGGSWLRGVRRTAPPALELPPRFRVRHDRRLVGRLARFRLRDGAELGLRVVALLVGVV